MRVGATESILRGTINDEIHYWTFFLSTLLLVTQSQMRSTNVSAGASVQ